MRKIFVENGKARLLSFVKSPRVLASRARRVERNSFCRRRKTRASKLSPPFSARRIPQSMLSISGVLLRISRRRQARDKVLYKHTRQGVPDESSRRADRRVQPQNTHVCRNSVMFTLNGRTLVSRSVDENEKYRAEREQSKNFKGNVKKLRNAAIEYRRAHKVELLLRSAHGRLRQRLLPVQERHKAQRRR